MSPPGSSRTPAPAAATDWGLTGKVAIVTGASSGIGAGIATYLAAAGTQVVLTGRDGNRLARTADTITAAGGRAITVPADLTANRAPMDVVKASLDAFGVIDIVIHSAGVSRFGAFEGSGPHILDLHYDINVRAPWALTHAALPHLGCGAVVVFISSNLAQVGQSEAAAYCASKGAVDAMSRALAVELAPRGIRVNTIAPGLTRTPMTHFLEEQPQLEAQLLAKTPAGRLGTAADMAPAVAYACSDMSSYMIGATILVDGGWNAY